MTHPLFDLDVLPGHAGIEAQIDNDVAGRPRWVRFRVSRRRRWRHDVVSEWSGWFVYGGEPIALRWESLGIGPP